MGRIEKTVFISYRRTNYYTALAVYQDLTQHGYDVFFDYESINSGDFEKVIFENIKAKAHFLVILSPSALERCNEPGDWLRREIEFAIDEKRNIIPLMMEGFDFANTATVQTLTGKLSLLKTYNGLRLIADYFFAAMEKLRARYLNVALEDMALHSLSEEVKEISEAKKAIANKAAQVEASQLTAVEWFESGYKLGNNSDEEIRCYTEAIRLDSTFADAYYFRGLARKVKDDLDGALVDFNKVIDLKPDDAEVYNARGSIYRRKGDLGNAIKDYTEAVRLKPSYVFAYLHRSIVNELIDNLEAAIQDYKQAIHLLPEYGPARVSLIRLLRKLGKKVEAEEQEKLARSLMEKETEYNRACFEAVSGNTDKALELLKIALEKKQAAKEWTRQDPDLENLREDTRFKELVGENSIALFSK